jgi:hypothetical protein
MPALSGFSGLGGERSRRRGGGDWKVGERLALLDGVAEVLARVAESLVDEGLDGVNGLSLPETRHERSVLTGKELQNARATRSPVSALETLTPNECRRWVEERVLDDDEHVTPFVTRNVTRNVTGDDITVNHGSAERARRIDARRTPRGG